MPRLRMPRPIPILWGRLVTLRPPNPPGDAADYFEMNRDPEMHTWTGNHVLPSIAEAQSELERFVSMDDVSTWMIVDNPNGRVVGRFFVCLEIREGLRVAGEGNRIARPFWRKGHNREARSLLFPYVFGELEADRIETGTWAGNVNSVKSIESFGFRFHHEEIRWNEKHGQDLPMRCYVMTREQWSASQAGERAPGASSKSPDL